MLKFEIKKYLKNETKTVLDLEEDGLISLVIQQSVKYTKDKANHSTKEVQNIIYKAMKDASSEFKKWTTGVN
jgi:predicted RNA-binding protein with RPS1 domain